MKICTKSVLSGIIALSIVLISHSALAAQSNKKVALRFGLASMPLIIEDMEDAHVSDWQSYGLGGSEGRMLLGMSEANMTSPAVPGIELGFVYRLLPELEWGGEMSFFFGDVLAGQISLAVDYYLWSNDSMRVGVAARGGFLFSTLFMGDAEILPGYANPVILDEVTIRSGDRLQAQLVGFSTSGGLSVEYDFNSDYSIRFDGGFQYGLLSSGTLLVTADGAKDSTQIQMDHPGIVKTDGSSTGAGVEPGGKTVGFTGGISVVYRNLTWAGYGIKE